MMPPLKNCQRTVSKPLADCPKTGLLAVCAISMTSRDERTSDAKCLSPKSAKSCHEKLLDPSKNHVTDFQLKFAKNSEILLKNLLFLRCLK